MIPDEAVEAVARILYARNDEWGQPSWEDAPNDLIWKAAQDDFRQDARELLEAAAPHLMSRAWNEGYDYHRGIMPDGETGNPYRKPAP